jgi:hypothetical protein
MSVYTPPLTKLADVQAATPKQQETFFLEQITKALKMSYSPNEAEALAVYSMTCKAPERTIEAFFQALHEPGTPKFFTFVSHEAARRGALAKAQAQAVATPLPMSDDEVDEFIDSLPSVPTRKPTSTSSTSSTSKGNPLFSRSRSTSKPTSKPRGKPSRSRSTSTSKPKGKPKGKAQRVSIRSSRSPSVPSERRKEQYRNSKRKCRAKQFIENRKMPLPKRAEAKASLTGLFLPLFLPLFLVLNSSFL